MHPIRILAAATAIETAVMVAALAIAGICGAWNGWLDVVNCFAPLVLIVALVGAGLALWSLEGMTRSVVAAMAIAGVAYGLVFVAPEFARRWLMAPPSGGGQIRLLTANVWEDNPTPGRAAEAILASKADVVFLQESDGSLRTMFPELRAAYPFASDCAGAGVTIFAKAPITAEGCGLGSGSRADLDLAWIRTTAPDGRPVTLATTHFSWPFPPKFQFADRTALAARLSQLPQDDLILAGDFNTTPWSFGMRQQEARLKPLTRRTFGWFSWPARLDDLHRPWSAPILPIDHVFAGPDWRTVNVSRVRIPGSDHFALEVVLSRPAEAAKAR
jgi:endonuclease/exonuclease/phosphatase (EEP) superfamily protein YafD